ncbi:hypothetical protein ACKKBG_A21590 [Auxenochlorella protothecoides x Auxenochlorella symbiontica]
MAVEDGETVMGEGQEVDSESESDSSEEPQSGTPAVEEEVSTWIHWFCGLKGNEFFCEVEEDYVQDDFNLSGLGGMVPYYDYALDFILEAESVHTEIMTEAQQEMVEGAAETLYGLIHARYVLTVRGLAAMAEKFRAGEFGRCPRVLCHGQPCLPVGVSDLPRQATVKLFCPRCEEAYYPRSRLHGNLDGAYFGTTMAHLLLLTYPALRPTKSTEAFVPRIFGFKIHPSAHRIAAGSGAERKLRRVQPASRGAAAPAAGAASNGTTSSQQKAGAGAAPPASPQPEAQDVAMDSAPSANAAA